MEKNDAPAALVMAYFAGQDTADGEQVRLAVSDDATPISWTTTADDVPLLTSSVGEAGVRDPFLLRDEARGRYVLIATDLRTWPDGDWERAVRRGSQDIVVWESPDLVTWSEPWLLRVAPQSAGNAWAPKAFWSQQDDAWLIIFASALYDADDDRSEKAHQRLLCVTTTDFRTVSSPQRYSDPGHDVIDATFVVNGPWWYRFSANTHGGTPSLGHHIFQERGDGLRAPYWAPVAVDIGRTIMRFAEGPAVFRSLTDERTFLLIDDIVDEGYHLLATDDLDAGQWTEVPARLPAGARHGSVLPVVAADADRLRAHLRSTHVDTSRASSPITAEPEATHV